jgi:hypothetical protein
MTTLLALLLSTAQAEVALQYGAAVTGVEAPQQSQYFSVQYSEPLVGGIRWRGELGGYTRLPEEGITALPSAFGNIGVGIRPNTGSFVMESYWGAGGISNPDSYLGGVFNFFHSFRIGVVGTNGLGVTLFFNHISSAGINDPNVGRDFAGFSWVLAL